MGAVSTISETPTRRPPALVHQEWVERYAWLVQGTTTRGSAPVPFDLGLFSGGRPRDEVEEHWLALGKATGMTTLVHAEQVHGSTVRVWDGQSGERHISLGEDHIPSGEHGRDAPLGLGRTALVLVDACDGHMTDQPGTLLAVTTADCVPIFAVDDARRAVAAIHAGWRGAAAGVLERGLALMHAKYGTPPEGLHVHLGPSICGSCYEVGPEVFRALDQEVPHQPEPLDLRGVLAARAVRAGVLPGHLTVSAHCTRCSESDLYSHRAGDAHRHVGYIGIRP